MSPDQPSGRTGVPVPPAVARVVQDLRRSVAYFWFNTIVGCPLLPRVARRALYRLAGASVQSGPGPGFVFVGDPRNLTIGSGIYVQDRVYVEAIAPISVGDDSGLGMESMIITSHHPRVGNRTWGEASVGIPVTIGERVWIGARVTILPGSTIDSDVIVAAGAVVSGHLKAFGLYGGVPARLIRALAQTHDAPPD
jgi:maltose O-acetyltransferase